MAVQHSNTNPPSAAGRVTVWDQLAHRQQTPQKEDPWVTRLEMTPQKTERGCQLERSQEPGRSHQLGCTRHQPVNQSKEAKPILFMG